jgi:hypothetical protein
MCATSNVATERSDVDVCEVIVEEILFLEDSTR